MAILKSVIPKGIEASGIVTTGADGKASISFPRAYPTKPKLFLSPELPQATDVVTVQIEDWSLDVEGNYIGAIVATGDDAGKAEANVPVHWLIVLS